MKIRYVWEHHGDDSLVYAENAIGAYTRGRTLEEALAKMEAEIQSYARWRGMAIPTSVTLEQSMEKESALNIRDADSDVIFPSERKPLTMDEYETLKSLAMKSARDFELLYQAVPDAHRSALAHRKTFYGDVPGTAFEMYEHTKSVNEYYFGEIGVEADQCGTIAECRQRGFEQLERQPDFLANALFVGNGAEEWSLRKVLRRFIWHDRIHAKAMVRMARKTFPETPVPDVFHFE